MNSKDVLVSISCTTYNHIRYIDECLEGFLKQKCDFKFEVLIHDDASTDGTIEVINRYQRKYPELIKPIIQKENQWSKGVRGMNAKYNFSRATGRYIALCEGDDYWTDPLKLQKQVDFLEDNEEFSFCAHYVNGIDKEGNILKQAKLIGENLFFNKKEILYRYFSTLSVVFRKSAIPPSYGELQVYNGDIYLFASLSCNGKAAILNFVGGNYRRHAGGVYTSLSNLNKYKNSIQTRRQMIKSNIFDREQNREIRKVIIKLKWNGMKNFLKEGDFKSIFFILMY